VVAKYHVSSAVDCEQYKYKFVIEKKKFSEQTKSPGVAMEINHDFRGLSGNLVH
jgi:hypothetical protein